jgi:hypothetical protein
MLIQIKIYNSISEEMYLEVILRIIYHIIYIMPGKELTSVTGLSMIEVRSL